MVRISWDDSEDQIAVGARPAPASAARMRKNKTRCRGLTSSGLSGIAGAARARGRDDPRSCARTRRTDIEKDAGEIASGVTRRVVPGAPSSGVERNSASPAIGQLRARASEPEETRAASAGPAATARRATAAMVPELCFVRGLGDGDGGRSRSQKCTHIRPARATWCLG